MYLGIDLGTSGVKALLLDDAQAVIATTDVPLDVSRPQHGYSEQNPQTWIEACEAAIQALKHSHGQALSAVRGIGLSGQMHGATLLDSADEVIRPCILWNDTRSHDEADQLNSMPLFQSITGNICFPGFTAPKLLWCQKHETQLFEKVASVLLPKDFLRLWLTGERVTDMSDASGTAWLNVRARNWSEELLAATGMRIEQMPRLVEGTMPSGQLRARLASQWGIKASVVVAGGAGDNAAAACGVGVVGPDRAFVSLGTSGVLFASNPEFSPNPGSAVHAFCHAVPEFWHQMGVILAATDSLNWFARLVGQSVPDLVSEAGEELTKPTTELFLPYLSGERTPHNDAHVRGVFSGLSISSSRRTMTRAILDGVSFAFRDNLNALAEAGTTLDRVTATGGGSRSRYWQASLATVLDLVVEVPADGEYGAAFGAARLGLIAAENQSAVDVCQPPVIGRVVEPNVDLTDAYDDAWHRFRELYPANRC